MVLTVSSTEPPITIRQLAVTAYLPTMLSSIGFGAVVPLIPLTATSLGAGVELAAFVVALRAIGQLFGDLPAGWIASRIGDKYALVGACILDAIVMGAVVLVPNLWVLALAVLLSGFAGSVFGLARHAYLTEVVPVQWRARAMSTLGGVHRVGFMVGPLAGAALVSLFDLSAGYVFAAAMSVIAAVIIMLLPDTSGPRGAAATSSSAPDPSLVSVLRAHSRVLATLGVGVLSLMLIRGARQAIVPLWAEHVGLDAAQTSLIFALSSALDVALFFPGGMIMDRFGRFWVCVPAMIVMGAAFVVLPLSTSAWSVAAVAALLGIGNGTSSGIVMTLGADLSPEVGRTKFLAGWRLFGDFGSTVGPLLISAITLFAPLTAAAVTLGVLSWAGAAWLGRFIPLGVGPVPRPGEEPTRS